MIYLVLSIVSSTGLFVVFKLFKYFNVNTLQAIVINYLTACICGILLYDGVINTSEIITSDWISGALVLGLLFITIFNVMALTAQRNGLSVASVASKMSVIIPVIFGIVVLQELLNFQKAIGIILALLAVYLTSTKPKHNTTLSSSIYLPIALFLGSGIIDTTINYYAPEDKIPLFSAVIFGFAFCIGSIIVLLRLMNRKEKMEIKSVWWGIILGLINYASIYFLLKALRFQGLESSTLFTVNNVAIVAISTIIGVLLFKETLTLKNKIGIGIAFIAILLVTLA